MRLQQYQLSALLASLAMTFWINCRNMYLHTQCLCLLGQVILASQVEDYLTQTAHVTPVCVPLSLGEDRWFNVGIARRYCRFGSRPPQQRELQSFCWWRVSSSICKKHNISGAQRSKVQEGKVFTRTRTRTHANMFSR